MAGTTAAAATTTPPEPTTPTTPPATPTTPPPTTPPAPEPTNPTAPTDPTKTTDPAKEQALLLEALGFSSVDELKAKLGKLQEIEDANKSELDKLKDANTKSENALKQYQEQVFTLTAEKAALAAQVNPDFVSDVVMLAKSQITKDVDITKAIGLVVEKYPHFLKEGATVQNPPPTFATNTNTMQTTQTDQDKWTAAFKQVFALK